MLSPPIGVGETAKAMAEGEERVSDQGIDRPTSAKTDGSGNSPGNSPGNREGHRQAAEGLLVVGLNHRTAGAGLRERLTIDDPGQAALLDILRAEDGLSQAMVLSTCDRVEVWTHCADPDSVAAVLAARYRERAGADGDSLGEQWFEARGTAAVEHIFAVAASLESRIVGEPHVLGQVKASHRMARSQRMTGSELEGVLQAAYGCAKRVRSETSVAEGPVSVAAAAVQTARDVHGALDQASLLLIGTADPGELFAEQFLASGLGRAVTTGRRRLRAEAMAARLGAGMAPVDRLPDLLTEADIVIAAEGGLGPVLGEETIRAALKRRRNRPMLILDLAVPADVEGSVHRLDSAFLYDLADLEGVAERNLAHRSAAAQAAWDLVQGGVAAYVSDQAERTAVPGISALVGHVEAIRDQAVAEAGGDAEKAARLLAGRLLHAPLEALRRLAAEDPQRAREAERLLRDLFDIKDGPDHRG